MWRTLMKLNTGLRIHPAFCNVCIQKIMLSRRMTLIRNFHAVFTSCFLKYSPSYLNVDACSGNEGSRNFAHLWSNNRDQVSHINKCITQLAALLRCEPLEARILIERHSDILLEEFDTCVNKIEFLISDKIGLPRGTVKNNVWILYLHLFDVQSRLNSMRQWGLEQHHIGECLLMLRTSALEFNRISGSFISERKNVPFGNRLVYLANYLECSLLEIVERVMEYKLLIFRDFSVMREALETYTELGIRKEDVLSDLSCLRCRPDLIRARLYTATVKHIEYVKPWLVRCTEKSFQRYIRLHENEILLFAPYKTRHDYLAAKLNLDEKTLQELETKHPIFFNLNIKKLVSRMDFFLGANYTTSQLLSCTHVFHYNLDTVKERYQEIKLLGIDRPTLGWLVKNRADYETFLQHMAAGKNPKIQH